MLPEAPEGFGSYQIRHNKLRKLKPAKQSERSRQTVSNNIGQLNEEIIRGQIKELLRSSIEETVNKLLEAEADKLTQAARPLQA